MHFAKETEAVIEKMHFSGEESDGFTVEHVDFLKFDVEKALESRVLFSKSRVAL